MNDEFILIKGKFPVEDEKLRKWLDEAAEYNTKVIKELLQGKDNGNV